MKHHENGLNVARIARLMGTDEATILRGIRDLLSASPEAWKALSRAGIALQEGAPGGAG